MQQRSIGQILKSARSHHKLDLQQVSVESAIPVKYLQALEENKFGDLPSVAYVKGYIRYLAKRFDLDYQGLLALLRRDYQVDMHGQLEELAMQNPRSSRSQLQVWSWPVLFFVSFFVIGFSYVLARYWQFTQPPAIEISMPRSGEVVAGQVQIVGSTDSDALLSINGQPVALQPDGSFQTDLFLTRQGQQAITIVAENQHGRVATKQLVVEVDF